MGLLRSRRRRLLVLFLALAGVSLGVWRWQHPRRENPTLAGVPLEERIQGLKDPDEAVRKRTLRTLAAFGPKSRGALPEVVAALDDPKLHNDAILALGRMREDALPTLTKWLRAERPKQPDEVRGWEQRRIWAVKALRFAGPCAISLLREYRDDENKELRSAARWAIVHVALEYPSLVPELAADIKDLNLSWSDGYEWRAAALAEPNGLDGWKSLLDNPDPEVRLFATRALVSFFQNSPTERERHLLDPCLIPGLAQDPSLARGPDREPSLFVRIHRAGHPVVPGLMTSLRAALAAPRDTRTDWYGQQVRETLDKQVRGIVSVLIEVGDDANHLMPEFAELLTREDRFSISFIEFLAVYEARRAPDSVRPSALPALISHLGRPDGPGSYLHLVEALQPHFKRAAPLLIVDLRRGDAARRNELLRGIRRLPVQKSNVAGEVEPVQPVSPELVRAVAECLREPRTRTAAIVCLGYFGKYAGTAVPALLDALDEEHLPAIHEAVGQISNIDPTSGPDLRAVRERFAKHPQRDKLLVAMADRPLLALLLVPERQRGKRLLGLEDAFRYQRPGEMAERFLNALARIDLLTLELLLHAERDWTISLPVEELVRHHGRPAGKLLPVVLRLIREDKFTYRLGALVPLCAEGTPKEVAEVLFAKLAQKKPDEVGSAGTEVLKLLLELKPLPGTWTVPEAYRVRTDASERRLAAAVALRWNPTDAAARATLLEGYPGAAQYDGAAARGLALLAVTDPKALDAIIDLFTKSGDKDFELLYGAVRAAGPKGTERLLDAYYRTHEGALLRAVQRLGADGAISLPEVFAKELRSKPRRGHLYDVMTDETAEQGLALLVRFDWDADRGNDWWKMVDRFLHEWNYKDRRTLRYPKLLPTLKKWLTSNGKPERRVAHYLLARTHPDDPDVRAAFEKQMLGPAPFDDDLDLHIFLREQTPEGALSLLKRHLLRNDEYLKRLTYPPAGFSAALHRVPVDVRVEHLRDPNPLIRLAALESLPGVESNNRDTFLRPADVPAIAALLADPDDRVRLAAWDALNKADEFSKYGRPPYRTPLDVLPPELYRAWLDGARRDLTLEPRLNISPERRARYAFSLELTDRPEFRQAHAELLGMLPKEAPTLAESNYSAAELINAFLGAGDRWKDEDPQTYFRLRAEILRRSTADNGLARELFAAYFSGRFGRALDDGFRAPLPAVLGELAPSSLPVLLEHLDRLDRDAKNHWHDKERGNELIARLAEFGPQARDAVPLLLTFAADKSVPRRLAARRALQKIAPEVFAELD